MQIMTLKINIRFLFLILISCSGRNQTGSYYQKEYIPKYQTIIGKEFTSPQKFNSVNFPIEASSFSYSNLLESVGNSTIPENIYTEELLNSFSYNYPKLAPDKTLGVYTEVAVSPWDSKRKLIHIGIYSSKERDKEEELTKSSKNLILAVDTSGSMSGSTRLELAKESMRNLIQGLDEKDNVAIIEYTDDARIILHSTSMRSRRKILDSINRLRPTGGTNAWPGILLAYKIASEMKRDLEKTKVVIVTDGDFGGVNNNEFLSLVEKESKVGIGISILGFGIGHSNVEAMNALSTSKKGDVAYIDSTEQAKSYLARQSWSTWKSLAKDINLEVKFNSSQVESFRLIGYENYNPLKTKSSIEVSSPFSYTALYEILPVTNSPKQSQLLTFQLNYKTNSGKSEVIKEFIENSTQSTWEASEEFRFAASVAGLGMLLNQSSHKGLLDYNMVIHLLQSANHYDPDGYRLELLRTVNQIKRLNRSEF